jgi:organic radical activating enzyme
VDQRKRILESETLSLTQLPQNFCVAPFLQITTHPTVSFSPCPYLGGTTWKNSYSSIRECWNSTELEELRSDFLNNQKNPICNRCWNEEKHDKKSLRLRLLDPTTLASEYMVLQDANVVQSTLQSIASGEYQQGPKILTIKNGNVCNAKCRVCHPNDSSRWIADANKLHKKTHKTIYRINQKETNWTDDQLDELFELSKNLLRLELFGGEPLYNKKVLRLLDRIIDAGHSKQLTLYINTNGSVNLIKQIPRIKEFKDIEIGVSIDDVGNRFEYIRHGIKYEDVISNVKSWQQYFAEHNVKYHIDSITTVSILNIYYLPEIKQAVIDLLGQEPFWNLLVDPDFLNITQMPSKLRKVVADRLRPDASLNEIVTLLDMP